MPVIFPCAVCGARDSRDESHQQGCPTLPPLSKTELIRLARGCERGWAEDGRRRAEREQAEARAEATLEYAKYLQARRTGRAPANSFDQFRSAARAELRRIDKGRMSDAELFRMYQQEFAR